MNSTRLGRPVSTSCVACRVSTRCTSSRPARSLAIALTMKLVSKAIARKICRVMTSAAACPAAKGPNPIDVAMLAPMLTTNPAAAAARVPNRMPAQISATRIRYGSRAAPLLPMSANASPMAVATSSTNPANSPRE